MAMHPYLFFNGRCEEAIDFYRTALGAEVSMLMRFDDSSEPTMMPLPPGSGQKIMHAALRVRGADLMASDGMCGGNAHFDGFSLSITATDAADARQVFDALADGGQVMMPLGKTFFSPCFGMVKDRFGVGWMVIVDPMQAGATP